MLFNWLAQAPVRTRAGTRGKSEELDCDLEKIIRYSGVGQNSLTVGTNISHRGCCSYNVGTWVALDAVVKVEKIQGDMTISNSKVLGLGAMDLFMH